MQRRHDGRNRDETKTTKIDEMKTEIERTAFKLWYGGKNRSTTCDSMNSYDIQPPPYRQSTLTRHFPTFFSIFYIQKTRPSSSTRPYHHTNTGSHPNAAVKNGRAQSVRVWETRLEACVLSFFFFVPFIILRSAVCFCCMRRVRVIRTWWSFHSWGDGVRSFVIGHRRPTCLRDMVAGLSCFFSSQFRSRFGNSARSLPATTNGSEPRHREHDKFALIWCE